MNLPKAVFFDIDGTLVDSNDYHVMAWDSAFRDSGYVFDTATLHRQIGKGADMLIPALLPEIDVTTRQAITSKHDAEFKLRYLPQVEAFPLAAETIRALHNKGVKVYLASSAKSVEVDQYVRLLGIKGSLAGTTSGDDVKSSKPAGDIFASALAKAAPITAVDALVVGDTPYDVIAAAKCHISTIALRSGGFADQDLSEAGASAIFANIADLKTRYFRL